MFVAPIGVVASSDDIVVAERQIGQELSGAGRRRHEGRSHALVDAYVVEPLQERPEAAIALTGARGGSAVEARVVHAVEQK